jgi:hypothetical protein
MSVDVRRPTIRGPGSKAEGDRVAETLASGLENGARELAATGTRRGRQEISRLVLRLPAGASEADIARTFQRALASRGRDKS